MHRVIMLALMATAMTLAVGARPAAAQTSQAYLDAYDKGVAAYRLGNFVEARSHFDKAIAIDPMLPGPYRWLTVIAQAEEKWDECLEHAVKAVELAPTSPHAPTVRALHAQCRKALNRPEFRGVYGNGGAIAVLARDVEGGLVKLNGLKYGALPLLPRAFAAGVVEVTVEVRGYLPQSKKAKILPGMVTDVIFMLEIDPDAPPPEDGLITTPTTEIKTGWVKLQIVPEGASITFDGRPARLDENGRIEAPPGVYLATVEAEGYEPWQRRVRVHLGQDRVVQVRLQHTGERRANRRKGYFALAAAGAFAVAGGVFSALESSAHEEAEDIWSIEVVRPTIGDASAEPVRTRDDLRDARDRGKRYALISGISFGVAAAALGLSIYYFVEERPVARKGFPLPVAVTPIGPGDGDRAGVGAQVTYTATFDGLW